MLTKIGILTVRRLRDLTSSLRVSFYRFIGCKIERGVFLGSGVQISNPRNVHIKKNAIIGKYCIISAFDKVTIGKDVQLGPFCAVYDSDHKMPLSSGKRISSEIKIGDGCWLGQGAIILKGVKLGENVTIGAGSVVTKSFPANLVIAGVPAKKIGENIKS